MLIKDAYIKIKREGYFPFNKIFNLIYEKLLKFYNYRIPTIIEKAFNFTEFHISLDYIPSAFL